MSERFNWNVWETEVVRPSVRPSTFSNRSRSKNTSQTDCFFVRWFSIFGGSIHLFSKIRNVEICTSKVSISCIIPCNYRIAIFVISSKNEQKLKKKFSTVQFSFSKTTVKEEEEEISQLNFSGDCQCWSLSLLNCKFYKNINVKAASKFGLWVEAKDKIRNTNWYKILLWKRHTEIKNAQKIKNLFFSIK
jgi:hypothetical protein